MFAVPFRTLAAVSVIAFGGAAHAADLNPTVDLTVNPYTISAGSTVTITGSVTNTSKKPTNYVAGYTITGPCGPADEYDFTFKLGSSQTRTASVNYTAPTCPGTYTVTVQVTSPGPTVLKTTSFVVQ